MTNVDDVRARFAATADRVAEHSAAQVEAVRGELQALVALTGDERTLDVGTGAGTLALAVAPLVREVVGADVVPELLAAARRAAPANVEFVEADATRLPFAPYSFDLVATRRTLHHVVRPELVLAELARVVRLGGTVLVEDQLAPVDPLAARALDAFERARDPSHTRLLPDVDLRHLFDANGLVLRSSRFRRERRALGNYLDLAGCSGAARATAVALSPGGRDEYEAESAWYVLRRV
jgi:ubiquinone/menaquinone biosynthesis C-methylase UbiE